MAAKIITVVNQKGGSGKTTVSMQLAGGLARKGKSVFVADTDPQGTASRWASLAPEDHDFPATVANLSMSGQAVHRELRKFVPNYDYIIVDCPPAVDSPVPQSALLVTDLALIPVLPSLPDLWATFQLKQLLQGVSTHNQDLKARLVINQFQPNLNVSKQMHETLQKIGIELAGTMLGLRSAYKESAAGQTVFDLGSRAQSAIDEVEALTTEVLILLGHL
jgi:chromosome partitioning protein